MVAEAVFNFVLRLGYMYHIYDIRANLNYIVLQVFKDHQGNGSAKKIIYENMHLKYAPHMYLFVVNCGSKFHDIAWITLKTRMARQLT